MHAFRPRIALSPIAARLLVASALMLSLVGLSIPIGAAPPGDLIVNGSFEDPPPDGADPELHSYFSIPGWLETSGCSIEIWSNGFIRAADDGAQLVELDSNCNSVLEQIVPTTAGTTYRLSYAISARPGTDESSNGVDVYADSVLVDSQSSGNTVGWDHHAVLVTASGSGTAIAFAGAGDNDTLGSLLDNVSLVTVATNMNQCKNGGWASVVRADGTGFTNQGDCVSYTNTGK